MIKRNEKRWLVARTGALAVVVAIGMKYSIVCSPILEKTSVGDDVVLTIDRAVQDALQDVLDKYADTNDTGRAWGVVMEAKTGAIRAIADTCSASEFTNGVGSVYSSRRAQNECWLGRN